MRRRLLTLCALVLAAGPLIAECRALPFANSSVRNRLLVCDTEAERTAAASGDLALALDTGSFDRWNGSSWQATVTGEQGPPGQDGADGAQGPPGDPLSACDAWPVGAIFISTTATNPGTSLGCGTWSAYAAGRVLVGFDAGTPEFDTGGETSGAMTHALTEAEMPAHSHGVTDPGHNHLTQRYPTATGGSSGFTIDTSMSGTPADNTLSTKSGTTGVTLQNTGSGQAISLLQPGITVYMFRRDS